MPQKQAGERGYISWGDVHDWSADLRKDTDRFVLFHVTPNLSNLGSEMFTVTLVLCKKVTNSWTAADIVVSRPFPSAEYKSITALMLAMLWDARAAHEAREAEAERQSAF